MSDFQGLFTCERKAAAAVTLAEAFPENLHFFHAGAKPAASSGRMTRTVAGCPAWGGRISNLP